MSSVQLSQASDAAQYGNKAVRLGAALRAGLPVPDGFALSADLVSRVAEQRADALACLAELLSVGEGAVAVRSSASGEDSTYASFAGQYKTELNVTTVDGLQRALQSLFLSGQSESAAQYVRRMGISGPMAMAAVVQRMVDAEVAGVLFTRDPMSGQETFLIEASWGLGEAVVAGLVTPDSFRLDPGGRVTERRAGAKDLQLRLRPDGGVQELIVSGSSVHKFSLGDIELQQLFALAKSCAMVFGAGLDIEWAYAKAKLYLLQCRPITR